MTSLPPISADEATVSDVVEEFVAAARDGRALNRTGRAYRPSALRDVAGILRTHLVPELGDLRLRDVQPEDVQRLVDDLAAGDLSLSRIRSVVSAFRALFGYARDRGIIATNPAATIDIARREPPPWADDDAEAYDDAGDAGEDLGPPTAAATFAWDDQPPPPPPASSHRPLPEALLGLVLRLVVVVFLIITLASLAQALLTPA
jgi:hypothetical protein